MKKFYLFAAVIVAVSCQSTKSERIDPVTGQVIIEEPDGETSGQAQSEYAELIPHPMIDNKGKVMLMMTLPANWKLHSEPGKAAMSGPNGIFVYSLPLKNYLHTTDPMMAQVYQQNGGKLRQPLTAEQVIRQDLLPAVQREGSRLVSVQRLPEIAKADSAIQGMMYTIGPRDARFDAAIGEFEDKDGKPFSLIVHVYWNTMGNVTMWNYSGQALDAPQDVYDSARQTLLSGLASLQYNPRYFDEFNQKEMNRESQSWAAHNSRMASNQRAFDAQQAAHREKVGAINQSIMASYESRNASTDRQHNRFLNLIKNEETVSNPHDGKRYQVESGSNHYWMNENGQYIGTNDPNYDPNRNQGNVNYNWNEVPIEN
jgi:hypothetical protein